MEVTKGENIKIVLVNDEVICGEIKEIGSRGITLKIVKEDKKDIINNKGKYEGSEIYQLEYEIFIPWSSILYVEKFIKKEKVGEVIE